MQLGQAMQLEQAMQLGQAVRLRRAMQLGQAPLAGSSPGVAELRVSDLRLASLSMRLTKGLRSSVRCLQVAFCRRQPEALS